MPRFLPLRGPRPALAIALALGLAAAGSAHAAAWIDTALPWRVLPGMQPADPLPHTFAIPARAWDYGAFSQRTDIFAKTDAVIIRLDFQVPDGKVGISLMTQDGAKLVSKEKAFTSQNGASHLFFRLAPPAQPSIIVLRNYDSPDIPGSITITRTRFVRESDLSNDELADIFKDGIL